MAGPSVVVRFLADLTGLNKAAADTGTAAQTAAGKMASAFHGVIGSLNQTGILGPLTGAIDGIGAALDNLADKHKSIGAVVAGVGAGVLGAGAALTAMGSKDQAAHQQLQSAIEATGHSYDDYGGQIEKTISKQEKYGNTANETMNALQSLTQATGDPQKALDLLGTASDLAAAKHESLTSAAQQLGKTYDGSARLLKEFNLAQDKTKDSSGHLSQAVEDLGKKLQGQASAAADTFKGKLDALKAHVEDMAAKFGAKYGPAIQVFGVIMSVAGMMSLASWGWVLLIVAAVAALIAIAILLYKNWDTIWGGISSIIKTVWNWIKDNWPLLLAILAGPFGLAVLEIVKHWTDIENFFKGLYDDIKKIFETVWNGIVEAFGAVIGGITKAWGAIEGFFKGLPGDVRRLFDDVWGGIVDAFKAVINGVIDVWNALHFTLPKVDILGVHIGGETIGVPRIPHFQAGGVMPHTGLALLHAGETVTPAGRAGPAVHIENVNIKDQADMDLLLAHMHFATMAGRL
jgi:hypothetical protein